MTPEPAIVFDTDCVLCSGMVAFILAHERDQTFYFVGAWSKEGLALATKYNFTRSDLDRTFLVIGGGTALTQSDAGLAVLSHLRAPWRWLAVLRFCPRFCATLSIALWRRTAIAGSAAAKIARSCRPKSGIGSSVSTKRHKSFGGS